MNCDNPKVSITIPVFNGSKYLAEAIDSAIGQTYENFEVIVINDGSDDGGQVEKIAKSYGDRVRYYFKSNEGVASALNMGIEKMTGEYFSWLSHDDVYYSNKLEVQVELLRRIKDPFAILYTNYELIDSKSRIINKALFDHEILQDKPLYGLLRGCIHGCSMLIPKTAFEICGLFDPKLCTTQDYDLWFKMRKRYHFIHMNDVLIKSRWHKDQGSKVHPLAKMEGNKLWINFIKELDDEEILQCEKTKFLFLENMVTFLSDAGYLDASEFAKQLVERESEFIKARIPASKVSVVIPFYNRIQWTLEATESALGQDHTNLEILLIDDGSTEDRTALKEMLIIHPQVKYLLQEHMGISSARNLGIDHCTGEYIAFLDSDDLWRSDKITRQLLFMQENGYRFGHTSYETFDAQGNRKVVDSGKQRGNLFPQIAINCRICASSILVERNLLLESGSKFIEFFKSGEDTCFCIGLAENNEIGGLDEPLTMVRLHGSNAAYDPFKQIIGLSNIASFLANRYGILSVLNELASLNSLIDQLIQYQLQSNGALSEKSIRSKASELSVSQNEFYSIVSSLPHKIVYRMKQHRCVRFLYFRLVKLVYRLLTKQRCSN